MVLLQTCKGNFKIELKHFLQYTFFSPLASSTKDRNSSICLIVGGVKSLTAMWRSPIWHSSHKKGKLHVMTKKKANVQRTRMHSSRMRTSRSLTICRSLLPGGGVSARGVSAPGGVCSGGSALGGLLQGGLLRGVSVLGGVYSGGVSAPGGWHPSMH